MAFAPRHCMVISRVSRKMTWSCTAKCASRKVPTLTAPLVCRFGFVKFETIAEASSAIASMDGLQVCEQNPER
jgi:hypothetical protein